ncbi:MAG: hypothetical protein KDC95_13500, partial [Planctomycetes bacterium]|nr:hypothetical protein [Planctomycetota bacterium]
EQAKAELRAFIQEGARSEQRVSEGMRQTLRKGLNLTGGGFAFGTGLSAVRGTTTSGIGDVIGESLGSVGAQLAQFVLGDLDEQAKATRSAREETIQAFGAIAGSRGSIPPGAKNFFDQIKTLRLQEEQGREIFERDARFRGPGVDQLINRIVAAFGELVDRAVDELVRRLNPVNWFT